MKKDEFLKKLSDSLKDLPYEERRDILYDYEEHFRIGNENGKSQDEIVELLGDPIEIAKQYHDIEKSDLVPAKKSKRKRVPTLALVLIIVALCIPVILIISSATFYSNNTKEVSKKIVTNADTNDSSINTLNTTGVLKVNTVKNLKINGINQVNVSSPSPSIKVIVQDRSDIQAKFYGKINILSNNNKIKIEAPELIVEPEGSTGIIEIVFPKSLNNVSYNDDLNVEIYLPKAYINNLKLTTASGNINADMLKLKNITFQTVSGNITGSSIVSSDTELRTTSGNITLNNYCGNINCNSVSGETEIAYSNFKDNVIIVNSVSGNIVVALPKTCSFSLNTSTVSGTIQNDFHGDKNNIASGNSKVSITNVSGNIQIKKTSPL